MLRPRTPASPPHRKIHPRTRCSSLTHRDSKKRKGEPRWLAAAPLDPNDCLWTGCLLVAMTLGFVFALSLALVLALVLVVVRKWILVLILLVRRLNRVRAVVRARRASLVIMALLRCSRNRQERRRTDS